MTTYLHRLVLSTLVILSPIAAAHAQFVGLLGSSTFSKETYSCRTYPGGEDIIIVKGGKSRTISKKAGSAAVDRALLRIGRILSGAKETLRDRRQRLKKLLKSSLIVLPSVNDEIQNLKNDLIPRAESRVEALLAQKSELTYLRTAVKNCGKAPQIAGGGNQLFEAAANGPVSGDQFYLIAARHVFTFSGAIPQEICVELDGKINSSAWTQNVCCQATDDSSGPAKPFSFCAVTGLRPDQGVIGLGGACGKFKFGNYDGDLAVVSKTLSKSARVFLPNKSGRCQ